MPGSPARNHPSEWAISTPVLPVKTRIHTDGTLLRRQSTRALIDGLSQTVPSLNLERRTAAPRFELSVKPEREVVRLEASGEFDLSSCGELHGSVSELVSAGFERLVIDVRRLTFVDVAGLRVMFELVELGRIRSCEISVIRGPVVARLLSSLSSALGAGVVARELTAEDD